jgi:hypothetical protein
MAQAKTTSKTLPTTKLSFAQLETLWVQAGGSKAVAPTMAAIALAESGGRVDAINNTAYPNLANYHPPAPGNSPEYSVGPWQVNTVAHKQYTPSAMLNPLQNAHAAVGIGGVNGERLSNWSTYNNGAFLSHLPSNQSGFLSQLPDALWNQIKSPIGLGAAGNPTGSITPQGIGTSPPGVPKIPTNIGKDILYSVIIIGGGLLVITGVLIIAADLGISAFAQKSPAVRVANKVSGSRARKASAKVSSQRQGELHTARVAHTQARVKTEQARATELRTRTRHRAAIAKGTKADREARDKRMMFEGAQAAAAPNLADARRRRKAS